MPKVSLDLELNTKPLEDGVKKAEGYIDASRKRLQDSKGVEYTIDLAKLKLELDKVNALIKQAIKDGDSDRLIQLKIDQVALQKQVVLSNRTLNNYINTGDQNYSALARLFDSVGISGAKAQVAINGIGSSLLSM